MRSGKLPTRVKLLKARYSYSLRLMHWLIAALVLVQFLLAGLNARLYEPRPVLAEALVQAHISVGLLILLCMLARILLRLHSPTPVRSRNTWVRRAATSVHLGFYGLLLVLPISGYLKLAAFGFPVTLFGSVALPVLPVNVALAQAAVFTHDIAALLLFTAIVAHLVAAFMHVKIDGQAVLGRMSLK